MKRIITATLLLFYITISFASINKIDSLELSLVGKEKDTSYVQTMLNLAELYYSFVSVEKCLQTSEQAKELADSLGYKCGIGDALNNIGTIKGSYYGEVGNGLNILNKAWIAIADANCNESRASLLNNRGYLYQGMGDIDKALSDYILSYEIRVKDNNEYGQALSLNQIGYLYGQQNMQEKAIETYEEALIIMQKLNDTYQQAILLNNIGAAYDNLNQDEKALEILNQCLALRIEMNDSIGLGYVYNNIAAIYRETNQVDKALHFFTQSLLIREAIRDNSGIVYSLTNLAKTALLDNDVATAIQYLIKAEKRAKKTKLRPQLNIIYKLQSEAHELNSDYKTALIYMKNQQLLGDSLFNESKSKEMGKLEAKFDFERSQEEEKRRNEEIQQAALQQKNRRDNLQYSGIMVVVLLLFFFVFMSGKVAMSERFAEGLIFFTFLLFFEFLLVLLDPYIETISGDAPAYKLLLNAILAAAIFPAHAFFENALKKKLR